MVICFVLGASGRGVGETAEAILLDDSNVVCEEFMGFGAEWDSASYDAAGVTDEHFAIIAERIRWMRLPVVRTMMLTRWCYRGDEGFDWGNRDMQLLYRQLDLCQKQGITVLLTDWGCETWTTIPGIENVADPKYAEAIGEYMDYLINQRGYSCIKYFILVNEPNYEVGDWDRWKQGVLNVSDVFKRRGLDKRVRFAGSDHSNAPHWHRKAVDELQDVLGAYDVHCYANDAMVRPGKLEAFFKAQWDDALNNDPNAKDKPFIVGEAGMNDHARHPVGNDTIDCFGYGLFMADYAVQAALAGSAAVCAWQLDDNCHEGFFWGLWRSAENGLGLRRWFYPWSLLCRYVPAGSTIYKTAHPSQDWRLLVASTPVGGGGERRGWTVCLVNRGDAQVESSVRLPDEARVAVKRYLYSQGKCPATAEGFPTPVAVEELDLAEPLPLTCPPRSVVLATTLPW